MGRRSRIGLDELVCLSVPFSFRFLFINVCDSDWLREKVYFDGLIPDKKYATTRLGFHAPNVFVVTLLA